MRYNQVNVGDKAQEPSVIQPKLGTKYVWIFYYVQASLAIWTGKIEAKWIEMGILNSQIHIGACFFIFVLFFVQLPWGLR